MNTGRYNVKALFTSTEIEQIIIPEIQRDYVWEESNVRGLMNSILDHFKEKEFLELDIAVKQTGRTLDKDVSAVLSEEYTRMVHSTRIGFIYAYHSPDYPGKFFLIDGQQRLTTIFLLLLAAYKRAGLSDLYRKNYFRQAVPKLDYKVREITHDFLLDFIRHETEKDQITPFTGSEHFYEHYNTDVTTSSLIGNYRVIEGMLEEHCKGKDNNVQLVDYIENYIEFNYFDTNISDQGEKLYLYMNSRGEDLSPQERLRPVIIGRSEDKLEAGIRWEKWQGFFWEHRGRNKNSDPGFQEFLRWCSFLHLCLHNGDDNNETKGNYIRKEKAPERLKKQLSDIRTYQEKTREFSIGFIDEVFCAVKKLEDLLKNEIEDRYIPAHWLSHIDNTNEYPALMACITYLMYHPDAELTDVRRVGMFIKNSMYGETNRKNPENATVNSVAAIKALSDAGYSDIMDLRLIRNNVPKTVYTSTDDLKMACCCTKLRCQWEELFWGITDDTDFSSFLDGDLLCLFEWSGNDVNNFRRYYDLMKKKIVTVVKSGTAAEKIALHEDLLMCGNFAVQYGSGNGIPRFYLLSSESEWTWGINNYNQIRDILRNYLDDTQNKCGGELYDMLIDMDAPNEKSVLGYMEYLELLVDNPGNDTVPTRFILPRIYQISGDNYRELMVQWVHQWFKGSTVWERDNINIPFDIKDGKMDLQSEGGTYFFISINYNWNEGKPLWRFGIGTKGKPLPEAVEQSLSNWANFGKWEKAPTGDKNMTVLRFSDPLSDDTSKRVHERAQIVKDFVDNVFGCIQKSA